MTLTLRNYQTEDDYWRIRAFLREVFLLNGRRELGWQPARLDYWRWDFIANWQESDPMEQVTFLWGTPSGEIAAVLNPEVRGDAHLQIHPQHRAPELLEEMTVVAEQRLATPTTPKQRQLRVWVNENDALLQQILIRRGYARSGLAEKQHYLPANVPLPDPPVAPGYTVRALGDVAELPARSWIVWKAFNPNEPDDHYWGWEWYRNIQRMPLYRRDLDIVAVAPDGEFASSCILWYDDATRAGYFEPVGTHPDHLRRGLGKAVMYAAMRRFRDMGGLVAAVGGYTPAANALYDSVMPLERELSEAWGREWLFHRKIRRKS